MFIYDNVLEIFGDYDFIVDGIDNFMMCYLINDVVVLVGKLYVWGLIYWFNG